MANTTNQFNIEAINGAIDLLYQAEAADLDNDNNMSTDDSERCSTRRVITEVAKFLVKVGNLRNAYTVQELCEPCYTSENARFEYNTPSQFSSLPTEDYYQTTLEMLNRIYPKMSLSDKKVLIADITRTLSGSRNINNVVANSPRVENSISMRSITGTASPLYSGNPLDALQSYVSRGLSANQEAFGLSINSVPMDNRLAIITSILRPISVLTDRFSRRIISDQVVHPVFIPAQYITDLARSIVRDSQTRGENNRILLVDATISDSQVLNTAPPRVIPLSDNDPDGKYIFNNEDGWLNCGVQARLGVLTLRNTIGYDSVGPTDLFSEGPSIETIRIQFVEKPDNKKRAQPINDPSAGPIFEVELGGYTDATYIQKASGPNSGGTSLNINFPVLFSSEKTTYQGFLSDILSVFKDSRLLLDIELNASLSLNETTAQAAGSVTACAVLASDPKIKITDEESPELKFIKNYDIYVVAYYPEIIWNEDNLHKTTTALLTTSSESKIVVRAGKNLIVEQQLAQADEEITIGSITVAQDIGTSARALQTVKSKWTDVWKITKDTDHSSLFNRSLETSTICIASRIVRPKVIRFGIDFDDSCFNIAYQNEQQRLGALQTFIGQKILDNLNKITCYSGYQQQLDNGEVMTFKVLTHARIADMLLGVPNFVATWTNPERVGNNIDADIILPLPNGVRLEIVKLMFTEYTNTIIIIPTRKNGGPNDVLSGGFTIDCGKYISDFRGTTAAGVVSRTCVANTREMFIPTNVIGLIIDIQNIDKAFESGNANNQMAKDINTALNKKSDNGDLPTEDPQAPDTKNDDISPPMD